MQVDMMNTKALIRFFPGSQLGSSNKELAVRSIWGGWQKSSQELNEGTAGRASSGKWRKWGCAGSAQPDKPPALLKGRCSPGAALPGGPYLHTGMAVRADCNSQEWFCGVLSPPCPWQPGPVPSCPSAGSFLLASGVQCWNNLQTIKGIKRLLNITKLAVWWVEPCAGLGWFGVRVSSFWI